MKSYAIVTMCFLLVVGILSASQAASTITQHEQVTILVSDSMYNLLGSRTFSYDATSAIGVTQPQPLTLTFTLGIDSQPGKTLFEDVPLLQNVGKTVCINAACAHPSYSAFVETLTDGRNDRLSGIFSVNSPQGPVSSVTTHLWEKDLVQGGASNDFKGMRIGKICIRVDSASILQRPIVVGAVPEPSAVSVLLGGLACVAGLWRRRRAR